MGQSRDIRAHHARVRRSLAFGPWRQRRRGERGSASVEQAGLVALIALLLLAGDRRRRRRRQSRRRAAAWPARSRSGSPALPAFPSACRHHPLVPAYGWPLARLARALAPAARGPARPLRPSPRPGRLPPLPPRKLRRRRGAPPDRLGPPHHRLHPAPRPPPLRRLGRADLLALPPRPRLGAHRPPRRPSPDRRRRATSRVLLKDDPALVPLETLPGRNHYDFPPGERPPWQWQVHATYPGWSSRTCSLTNTDQEPKMQVAT